MLDSSEFLVRTLLEDGLVTEGDVKRARARAAEEGVEVSGALVALGIVTSRQLTIARARICEYPFVDLGNYDIDLQNARLLPRGLAERFTAFPLFAIQQSAVVAMVDPMNLTAIDQLRQMLRMEVEPVLCDPEPLRTLIARAYTMVRADGPQENGSRRSGAEDSGLTTG
mgnify:CR=1 FL=1